MHIRGLVDGVSAADGFGADGWRASPDFKTAYRCGVVERWPANLQLLEFSENVFAEVADNVLVTGSGGVGSELHVQTFPCQTLRLLALAVERESFVGKPHLQVEAERGPLHLFQDSHVERNRVSNDLVEERLPQMNAALPERLLVGLFVEIGKRRVGKECRSRCSPYQDK